MFCLRHAYLKIITHPLPEIWIKWTSCILPANWILTSKISLELSLLAYMSQVSIYHSLGFSSLLKCTYLVPSVCSSLFFISLLLLTSCEWLPVGSIPCCVCTNFLHLPAALWLSGISPTRLAPQTSPVWLLLSLRWH